MRFSRRTLANLARLMGNTLGHTELNTLFYEYKLETNDRIGNREDRSRALLQGLEEIYNEDDASRIIIEIIERILVKAGKNGQNYQPFINALKIDGFEWKEVIIDTTKKDASSWFPNPPYGSERNEGRLLPTTPMPAALAPEISSLENELKQLGMMTASTHYAQAVNNFIDGNWESCNGQIRPFVEDLYIGIGERLTGIIQKEPLASLQDLKSKGFLDEAEFNQFKSFFSGIQDNGPHRGLSNEQEALFRLHISTSIARYLIFKAEGIKPK